MTPAQLADHLEDGPGEVRIESLPHMQLLAAALRLAEAVLVLSVPPKNLSSIPDLIRQHNDALANYRSARERLSSNAP